MKKFQFSLESVLGYKQQVLESLQNEHAILIQKMRQQEERLRQMEESYRAWNEEFRQAEMEGITVAEVMRYESGLRFWEKEIAQQRQTVLQCQREVEQKRRQVVAARQETASLEKLREKKQEEYRKAVQKGEELFIEEVVAAQKAMAALS
ncbi:flagellar export protein FliJ [Ruminococcaceae bacterium AM28-23LB]|nr:flagellar export protein FliJ [Ruminococcaceae bacterium AM28-23LB]